MKLGFHPQPWFYHVGWRKGSPTPDFWQVFEGALRDMSATGWDAVEISHPYFERSLQDPEQMKRLLGMHRLRLSTFYHSRPFDQMSPDQAAADARPKCEFLRQMGSSALLLDGGARNGAEPRDARVRAIARCANAVAAVAQDFGLTTAWHIHWGSIFEESSALDLLMDLTEPALVTLCPDTAQMALGDYDIPATFAKHADRIGYVHFKDLAFLGEQGARLPHIPRRRSVSERGAWGPNRSSLVLEPGQGAVDFTTLWRTLAAAGFDGWIVVDLDYSTTTPLESSRVSQSYLAHLVSENLPGAPLPRSRP
jgi:inosose dehydratase